MYEILDFLTTYFDTIFTVVACVIVAASALCALLPGSGLLKKILSILALNVKNATPEQLAKAKAALEAAKVLTKPDKKKSSK